MYKKVLGADIYDSREINFIKIFHKILLTFTVLAVLGFIFIPINDSISYKSGEVISKNPQIDFIAPFEAIPKTVFVSKGDKVKKGDTLMIIDNASLDKDFSSTQGQYVTLEQQDKTIDIDKLNTEEKIEFLIKEKSLNYRNYNSNKRRINNNLIGINNKITLLREQQGLKRNKSKSDTIMYKKEVISLVELRNSYNDYLNVKNEVVNAQNEARELQGQLSIIRNEYQQKANDLEIQISDLKATQGRLDQQKEGLSSRLVSQGKSVDFMKSEIDKQYVTSSINGVVSSLFNENQAFNYINKGESLAVIAPDEETFYARAKINEKDLKYIKVGQKVHMKLDAYHYFQYGIIKGEITVIPERKSRDNNFYVIIDLPEDKDLSLRSGYSLEGDIILEKMRLGQYLMKKVFQSYDSKISTDKKPAATPNSPVNK